MSDEVRDMIARALADEPPIGIDYESVRAAGRRRLARRNLGIVGGAVLAVVVLVSATITVRELSLVNAPAGLPATTPVNPAPDGCVVPAGQGGFSMPSRGQAGAGELAESARLTEAFHRFAVPLERDVTMDPAWPALCAVGDGWGTRFTLLRTGVGQRQVILETRPRLDQQSGDCVPRDRVKCEVRPLSGGGVVRVSITSARSPIEPVVVEVDAWRADGTVVRVIETGLEGPNPTPRILGDEALTTIAVASALKVEPPDRASQAVAGEPSERRAGELTATLANARALPADIEARPVPGASVGPLSFYVSQGGYKLNADLLADSGAEGNLFISLSPPAGAAPPVLCGGVPDCTVIKLPGGRPAAQAQHVAGKIRRLTVSTIAADGTGITVMTSNQPERRGNQPELAGSTPLLGFNDLARLAALPDLHW